MLNEPRLFRLATEAMHLQASFVGGKGWHLTVVSRRQGEQWSESEQAIYSHLSTAELADVICSELQARLGLV